MTALKYDKNTNTVSLLKQSVKVYLIIRYNLFSNYRINRKKLEHRK